MGYIVIDSEKFRNDLKLIQSGKDIEERGAYIQAIEIADVDIRRGILQTCKWVTVAFARCDLGHTDLSECEWKGCTFTSCSFDNTYLARGIFEDCVFDNCGLMGATFGYCRFVNCQFKSCKLAASFYQADLRGCSVFDCDISYANFSEARLNGFRLVEAKGEPAEAENTFVDLSPEGDGSKMISLQEAMAVLKT